MSSPAVASALTEAAWLDELGHRDEFVEVVDGSFVVKRVGGNPHHRVARLLANAFEEQWAGCVATAPGNWVLAGTEDGLELARMPDVLVDGDELLQDSVYYGPALAAVEVWSPGNSLEEMNRKRREYREAGLPVFLEAFITDAGDVHLEWHLNARDRWDLVAVAVGDTPLRVSAPRPFAVLPNDLLRR